MGRKNKEYSINLHDQIYRRLTSMQAFGESKKQDMQTGEYHDKIYSFSTYKTYYRHAQYFARWVEKTYPECTTLKSAKKHANEWLQTRAESVDKNGQHLSFRTLKTEAAALNKLYGLDEDQAFKTPKCYRADITKGRVEVENRKHFSAAKNADLVAFCRATGLRREGVEHVRIRDFWTAEKVQSEIARIEGLPQSARTAADSVTLRICKDTAVFTKSHDFFVRVKEKGGRERLAPVVAPEGDMAKIRSKIDEIRFLDPDGLIFGKVNKNANIHGYRRDYAARIYHLYSQPLDQLQGKTLDYTALTGKTTKDGKSIQKSAVYSCRVDMAGRQFDRAAMLVCSRALGHNREDVVANNYSDNF